MTQESSREAEMSALDFLLKGEKTAFQKELLEMARQKHWDEDDPGFAVPLATVHIEQVLEVYPERIKAAMEEISRQQAMKWERIQGGLKVSALQSTQTVTRMTSTLTDAQLAMDRQLSRAAQLMQDEREALVKMMADERRAMMQEAMEIAEQQKQVLEARTQALIEQGALASQQRAETQVQQIVKGVRMKHFWETVAVAIIAALALVAIGSTTGWVLGRQQRAAAWNGLEQQVAIQRVETSWLLEKANRAECFYGIKAQSDPQCQ